MAWNKDGLGKVVVDGIKGKWDETALLWIVLRFLAETTEEEDVRILQTNEEREQHNV